jgi:hypothetical protein
MEEPEVDGDELDARSFPRPELKEVQVDGEELSTDQSWMRRRPTARGCGFVPDPS